MDQLIIVGVTVLLIGVSLVGTIAKRVMRSVEARRMQTLDRERSTPKRVAVSGARQVVAPALPSRGLRGDFRALADGTSADIPTERAPASLERIRSLPPLKQAIVWSELISRPVSERSE